MPRKIQDITRATLEAVPLPVHAATYTVISHKSIMDYALAEITAMGFTVHSEEYRATHDGQIAQGIYQLNYNSDPEMSLMFAWTNSYNKQIRFKCAVGGYVHANQTVMLCGEIGTYARKHTGTADADTIAMMQTHLSNAQMYYDNLVADKEAMKLVSLSSRRQAEILGVLFAEYEILTTEQASIIRQQMDKPSFFYNGGKDTLWSFYNHATVALQQSHPRTWMEDQRMLHWFITNEFGLDVMTTAMAMSSAVVEVTEPLVDPLDTNYGQPANQTNLLIQIAEETGDDSVLKAQYPVTPEDAFMSAEVVVMDLGDPESTPEPLQDYIERTAVEEVDHVIVEDEIWTTEEEPQKIATILDDVIQYEDPAGNTFEAPVVDDFVSDEDEDAVLDQMLVPVAPQRVKFAIDNTEEEPETSTEFDFDLNFEDEDDKPSSDFFL
jgi:hypothetical protein